MQQRNRFSIENYNDMSNNEVDCECLFDDIDKGDIAN